MLVSREGGQGVGQGEQRTGGEGQGGVLRAGLWRPGTSMSLPERVVVKKGGSLGGAR